ncbi:hypothetical protein D3C86_2070900 [compost metagenome]
MDCRLRLFYAVAGYDYRQYRPPLDGEKPWGKSAAYAHGDCLLRADGGRDAACERLDGGQNRRTKYLFRRHRPVYPRLVVLRPGRYAE